MTYRTKFMLQQYFYVKYKFQCSHKCLRCCEFFSSTSAIKFLFKNRINYKKNSKSLIYFNTQPEFSNAIFTFLIYVMQKKIIGIAYSRS